MRQFSTEHLVVLALTAALCVAAIRTPRATKPLAVAIGGAYLIELSVRATDGTWGRRPRRCRR